MMWDSRLHKHPTVTCLVSDDYFRAYPRLRHFVYTLKKVHTMNTKSPTAISVSLLWFLSDNTA